MLDDLERGKPHEEASGRPTVAEMKARVEQAQRVSDQTVGPVSRCLGRRSGRQTPRYARGCVALQERRASALVNESLRTNADDRLSCDPVGRVEGRDGIVERRDIADVRPQSSVAHPLDNLTELATIGLDNEVDRQAVGG
jgi:hypothetical protein